MIEEIRNGNLSIGVNSENGQLCSIKKNSTQIMWRGGSPSASRREKDVWANSSPVMFPAVGPTNEIVVEGIRYGMVQHGIARHLPWEVKTYGEKISVFQEYDGKPVEIKHKRKEMKLQFPFSYELSIEHKLAKDSVESEFSIMNKSDREMPYDFGWHPAFNVSGDTKIIADEEECHPRDVYEKQTLLLEDANEICLESVLGKIAL
jgi:galactose mutarotase-like enzyme